MVLDRTSKVTHVQPRNFSSIASRRSGKSGQNFVAREVGNEHAWTLQHIGLSTAFHGLQNGARGRITRAASSKFGGNAENSAVPAKWMEQPEQFQADGRGY